MPRTQLACLHAVGTCRSQPLYDFCRSRVGRSAILWHRRHKVKYYISREKRQIMPNRSGSPFWFRNAHQVVPWHQPFWVRHFLNFESLHMSRTDSTAFDNHWMSYYWHLMISSKSLCKQNCWQKRLFIKEICFRTDKLQNYSHTMGPTGVSVGLMTLSRMTRQTKPVWQKAKCSTQTVLCGSKL